jgi:hypothetical protein
VSVVSGPLSVAEKPKTVAWDLRRDERSGETGEDDRGQRTDDRRQRTDDRGQRAEFGLRIGDWGLRIHEGCRVQGAGKNGRGQRTASQIVERSKSQMVVNGHDD